MADIDLTIDFKGGRSDAGMDLDLDMDVDMYDGQDDARTPTSHAIEGVREGIKDYTKDADNAFDLVRHTLPEHMQNSMDGVNKAATGVAEELRKVTADLKPEIETITTSVKQILPEGKLRTMVSALESRMGLNEAQAKDAAASAEKQHSESVASKLDEMFKLESKRKTAIEVDNRIDSAISRRITTGQHEESVQTLLEIKQSVEDTSRYTTGVTSKYQRRALELQYKQVFLTRSLLEETIKTSKVRNQQFENITKNTSLPEYAKLRLSERIGEKSRDAAISFASEAAFGEGGAIGNWLRNKGDYVKTKLQQIKEGTGEIAGAASSAADMVDVGRTMAEFDNPYKSNAAMATGMGITAMLKKGIDAIKGNPADRKSKLNKLIAKIEATGHRLPDKLKHSIGNLRSTSGGKFASAWNAVVNTVEEANDHTISYNSAIIDGVNPDGYGIDKPLYTSVTSVIPGYLARILQEQQAIRLGTMPELTLFDGQKERFTTDSGLSRSIAKTINHSIKDRIKGFDGNVDTMLSETYSNSNNTPSETQQKKFKRLTKQAFAESMSTGAMINNVNGLLDTKVFKKAMDKDPALLGLAHAIFNTTGQTDDQTNREAASFNAINENLPNMTAGVVALTKQYGMNRAIQDKLVIIKNNEYQLHPKTMVDMLNGKISGKKMSTADRRRVMGAAGDAVTAGDVVTPNTNMDALLECCHEQTTLLDKIHTHLTSKPASATPVIDEPSLSTQSVTTPQGEVTVFDEKTYGMLKDVVDAGNSFTGDSSVLKDISDSLKGLGVLAKLEGFVDRINKVSLAGVRKLANYSDEADVEKSGIMNMPFRDVISAGYNTAWRSVQSVAMLAVSGADKAATGAKGIFKGLFNKDDGGSEKKTPIRDAGTSLLTQSAALAGTLIGGLTRVATSALESMPTGWGKLVQGFSWMRDKLFSIPAMFSTAKDVYVTGFDKPVLLKIIMENEGYLDKATGKVIKTVRDIKGDVVDTYGNLVLSTDMMAAGAYDAEGNSLNSILPTGLLTKAKQRLSGVSKWIKSKLLSVGSFVSDLWSTITSVSKASTDSFDQLLAYQKTQTQSVTSILALMRPKYNDRDNDGKRDGAYSETDLKSSGGNVGKWGETEQSGGKGLSNLLEQAGSVLGTIGNVLGTGAALGAGAYLLGRGNASEYKKMRREGMSHAEAMSAMGGNVNNAKKDTVTKTNTGTPYKTLRAAGMSRRESRNVMRSERKVRVAKAEDNALDSSRTEQPRDRAALMEMGMNALDAARAAKENAVERYNERMKKISEARSARDVDKVSDTIDRDNRQSRRGWTTRLRKRSSTRAYLGTKKLRGRFNSQVRRALELEREGLSRRDANRISTKEHQGAKYNDRMDKGQPKADAARISSLMSYLNAGMSLADAVSLSSRDHDVSENKRSKRERKRSRRSGLHNGVSGAVKTTAKVGAGVIGGAARAAAWTGSKVLGGAATVATTTARTGAGAANILMAGASSGIGLLGGFLASPPGLALMAIAGAGAAFAYRKEIAEGFGNAMDWVGDKATDSAGWIARAGSSFSSSSSELMEDVSDGVKKYSGIIAEGAVDSWNWTVDSVKDVGDWIGDKASKVKGVALDMYDAVTDSGVSMVDTIGGWLNDTLAAATGSKTTGDTDKPWTETIADNITKGVVDIALKLADITTGGIVSTEMKNATTVVGITMDGKTAKYWNRLGVLEQYRMKMYGMGADASYGPFLQQILKAEQAMVAKKAITVVDGKVVFDRTIASAFIGQYFKVDLVKTMAGNRANYKKYLAEWLGSRFIPVMMMYVQAMADSGVSSDLNKLSELKGSNGVNFITSLSLILSTVSHDRNYSKITQPTPAPFATLTSDNKGFWDSLINGADAKIDQNTLPGLNIKETIKGLYELVKTFVTGNRANRDDFGTNLYDVTNTASSENFDNLSDSVKKQMGYGLKKAELVKLQESRLANQSFDGLLGDPDGTHLAQANRAETEALVTRMNVTVAGAVAAATDVIKATYATGTPKTDSTDQSGIVFIGEANNTDTMTKLQEDFRKHICGMALEFYNIRGVQLKMLAGYRSAGAQATAYTNKLASETHTASPYAAGLAVSVDSGHVVLLDKMGLLSKYGITIPIGGDHNTLEPMVIQGDVAKHIRNPDLITGTMYKTYAHAGGGWGAKNSPWKEGGARRNASYMMRLMRLNQDSVDPTTILTDTYDKLIPPKQHKGRNFIQTEKQREAVAKLALKAATANERLDGDGNLIADRSKEPKGTVRDNNNRIITGPRAAKMNELQTKRDAVLADDNESGYLERNKLADRLYREIEALRAGGVVGALDPNNVYVPSAPTVATVAAVTPAVQTIIDTLKDKLAVELMGVHNGVDGAEVRADALRSQINHLDYAASVSASTRTPNTTGTPTVGPMPQASSPPNTTGTPTVGPMPQSTGTPNTTGTPTVGPMPQSTGTPNTTGAAAATLPSRTYSMPSDTHGSSVGAVVSGTVPSHTGAPLVLDASSTSVYAPPLASDNHPGYNLSAVNQLSTNDATLDILRKNMSGKSEAKIAERLAILTNGDKYAKELKIPKSYMRQILAQESRFGATVNEHAIVGAARGVGQFYDGAWSEMRNKYGHRKDLDGKPGDDRFKNLRGSRHTMYAAGYIKKGRDRMVKDHTASYMDTLGATGYYLPHLMGPTGASNFIKAYKLNPNTLTSTLLSPKAVRDNPSMFKNKTLQQTLDVVKGNFSKRKKEFGIKDSYVPAVGAEGAMGAMGATGLVPPTGGEQVTDMPSIFEGSSQQSPDEFGAKSVETNSILDPLTKQKRDVTTVATAKPVSDMLPSINNILHESNATLNSILTAIQGLELNKPQQLEADVPTETEHGLDELRPKKALYAKSKQTVVRDEIPAPSFNVNHM